MPDPENMLKLPSVAKGTPLRGWIEAAASKSAESVEQIIECVHLAARIEHLSAIGGDSVRDNLLASGCMLNSHQIAKLCRRMPPFIAVKLKGLEAGIFKSDTNEHGAFDTNGWAELRVRLPKFRSILQHFARQSAGNQIDGKKREEVKCLLVEIQAECEQLLIAIGAFTPHGLGRSRKAKEPSDRAVDWSQAGVRFSQVLGVLRKTNRDLTSKHWKPEWIPTEADFEIVRSDVQEMKQAANRIGSAIK